MTKREEIEALKALVAALQVRTEALEVRVTVLEARPWILPSLPQHLWNPGPHAPVLTFTAPHTGAAAPPAEVHHGTCDYVVPKEYALPPLTWGGCAIDATRGGSAN